MKVLLTTLLALATLSSVRADEMAAYLMAYFKDDTHSLYFALSSDGYSFTDVNGGEPVMDGEDLGEQRGIRDPHIARDPEGNFYLSMTDLHIYAQRDGHRDTEWQRDGDRYGWGNNRALVLLKSKDLVEWKKTNLRIDRAYPGLEDIGAAWAPQTVWDEGRQCMMLYYTMRFGNAPNRLYYTHMDAAFTRMTARPELLFKYPKDVSYIDADIMKVGDRFHMFYTPHDGTPGIKHASSASISSGYVYEPEWIDPVDVACEAPNLWKRIGEDRWVLMYDIYGRQPHNFGFIETTDFKSWTNLGTFNHGVMRATNFSIPKHGSVVHLTKAEAGHLARHWKLERY